MRMKKCPPPAAVECWADSMMFAPRAARKPETAATIPGPSGQSISSRARSRVSLRSLAAASSPSLQPIVQAVAQLVGVVFGVVAAPAGDDDARRGDPGESGKPDQLPVRAHRVA